MGDTIRCEDCGAAARASDEGTEPDRFCRFCGAAFRVPEAPVAVVVQETRTDERERRFAELEEHESTRRARRSKPSAAPTIAKHSGGLLMLFVVLGVALVIGGFQCSVANEVQDGFLSSRRAMPPDFPSGGPSGGPGGFGHRGGGPPNAFFSLFKIIPVAIIGFIVFKIFRSGSKTARVMSSPTRSWPACVIDETTETRGHGDNRHTVAIVTLERENGERESFEVGHRLARQVTRDDMGIAHSRGDELIGFTRIDV